MTDDIAAFIRARLDEQAAFLADLESSNRDPHGEWMRPTTENHRLIEQAEREHDLSHHTPAILRARP